MGFYGRSFRQVRVSLAVLVIVAGVLFAGVVLGKNPRSTNSRRVLSKPSTISRIARSSSRAARTDALERVYAALPLGFEPNEGQTNTTVQCGKSWPKAFQ
jgi:hypothetical protein